MTERLSPMCLEYALVFHWAPRPAEQLRDRGWDSESGRQIREWLFCHHLIDREDDMASGTERLGVWVEALGSVPLPVQEWRIPWEETR